MFVNTESVLEWLSNFALEVFALRRTFFKGALLEGRRKAFELLHLASHTPPSRS